MSYVFYDSLFTIIELEGCNELLAEKCKLGANEK